MAANLNTNSGPSTFLRSDKLCSLISAPRSSPPVLPHLDKIEPYTYVRAKMIAAGWKPYHAADADICSDGDKRCEGRSEMQSCAGTGMANCIFTWSNGQRFVGITSVGEDDPVVDGAKEDARAELIRRTIRFYITPKDEISQSRQSWRVRAEIC
ncbi:hypothetical protein CBM2626_U60006 [Cupriavidus taiwanensis]|uniref:Uncharacterized protein n=1 Tax=Cupriavidus taiwanensis TaxID=164546 RepID=A0A375ED35_9BURK|nr:hypothetical protein CBM2614_U90007 [Cupriavidus taiwanensis]SOZ74204.1 hypothetical protein CBM2615_U80007 [Cupriavidus taiwanensis]SOZ75525.1 hypothetical protein CBM2613_U80007 [Cupriavidus taiwanensis]SPA03924.1 hypothetical protein CBM2626_U60006 [Cupriavidus taiwanensis]SPA13074.1 hypothetical protein CBM2625_U90008 [Cupriavidus taiwanensis]